MSLPLHQSMTLPEFLAWEARQPFCHEFDGLRPVAMTGGTAAHALIQRNLAISIDARLRGTPCTFYGSDLKIETAGRIRYPDGFVACTLIPPRATLVRDPVTIFEVLSASTSGTDRITKNQEYAALPSVQRYVMLEQDRIGATVFARVGADWLGHILTDDATLTLPEIGLTLPLAELYEGVDLAAVSSTEAG